jgi:hypothetical protein
MLPGVYTRPLCKRLNVARLLQADDRHVNTKFRSGLLTRGERLHMVTSITNCDRLGIVAQGCRGICEDLLSQLRRQYQAAIFTEPER